MATFNPDQNPQSPDDTAASKGFKPNTAFADLFGAAGEIGVAAVNIKDQDNLIGIQKEVNQEIDQATDEWGVRGASTYETNIMNSKNVQPLPQDVARYGKELALARKAHLNGGLRDSQFQARIDSMSRQIRARYPGYREEIDGIISKTLGLSTANDLRKSLMQEWAAEQASLDDATKAFNSYVVAADKAGALPADYYQREAAGNPYSQAETKAFVSARYLNDANVDRVKKQYELEKASSDSSGRALAEVAQADMANTSQKVFSGAFTVAGMKLPELQAKVQAGLLKPWSPTETAELTANFAKMEASLNGQLWAKVNDPYYSKLDPAQKKALVDQGMEQMKIIKEQVIGQQLGLINFSKTMNDTTIQDGLRVWSQENPLVYQSRIAKLYSDGSPVMDSLLLGNKEMSSGINNALTQLMTINTMDPEKKSLQQIFQDAKAKQNGQLAPEIIKQTVANAAKGLLQKDVSLEAAQQFAKILFSEENQDFLGDFTQKSQTQLFDGLITPRMTERIQELAKSDPQIGVNYRNWVLNSFTSLFNQDIATINDLNQFGDTLQIKQDAATGLFKMEANPAGAGRSAQKLGMPGGTLAQLYEGWANSQAKASMDNLNKYIRQLKPIIEAEGGDVNEALTALFESQGVGKAKNQGSLYFRLYNALGASPEAGKPIGAGKGSSKEAIEKAIKPENPELQGFDLDASGSGKMKKEVNRERSDYNVDDARDYIQEAAVARGIDPQVALRVAKSEGLARGVWQSEVIGGDKDQQEPSYGPFQLLKGGGDTGFAEGLGNRFEAETGLDPADPKNWKAAVDFALDVASEEGWGAWYGARKIGIRGKMGINGGK
jgi:hypothetical protein